MLYDNVSSFKCSARSHTLLFAAGARALLSLQCWMTTIESAVWAHLHCIRGLAAHSWSLWAHWCEGRHCYAACNGTDLDAGHKSTELLIIREGEGRVCRKSNNRWRRCGYGLP